MPELPSSTSVSPSTTDSIRCSTPTTVGISNARARIAACEVTPPDCSAMPAKLLVADQRQLRERQLLGHDDRRLGEGRALLFLPQMPQHAMADVAEVGRALAQVVVRDRQHRRAQLVDHAEQRALGRVPVGDSVADAADELLVLENHAMAVENLEIGLRHQRRHPDACSVASSASERASASSKRFCSTLGSRALLIAIDGAQKCADDVRVTLRKSRRGRQAPTRRGRRILAGAA